MVNSTHVSHFVFIAYYDSGRLKYLYFIIVLSLYTVIVGANVLLVVVICVNRSLHEPMYLFLCSLFVNELLGSTGLFPWLLFQILSDTHTVPVPCCFLQIFCVYSYGSVEYVTLAVMSYDRYLAICFPLQYNTRMTTNKVTKLIALSWFLPFLAVVLLMSIVPVQFCGNIIKKLYCEYHAIVQLSCSDTTVYNIYGFFYLSLLVSCPTSLIVYTYMRILKVCFSGSKQTRQKAVSTCTPHLASLLNFSSGIFFEVIQSRFNMTSAPNMLRIFLLLYFLISQPIFNPLIYGLNLSKIRVICKTLVLGET